MKKRSPHYYGYEPRAILPRLLAIIPLLLLVMISMEPYSASAFCCGGDGSSVALRSVIIRRHGGNGLRSSDSDVQDRLPDGVQNQGNFSSSLAGSLKPEEREQQQRRNRKRSFPPYAYYLSFDEARIKHTFISFVEHTFSSYDQVSRLVEPRNYARPEQFEKDAMLIPPTIDDIAPPASKYGPVGTALAWNRLPARFIVGTISYVTFPYLVQFLDEATASQSNEALLTLLNTFLPGVSIVLGTYFSLTLSILYERFSRMQKTITREASLLTLTYNHLVELFKNGGEEYRLVESVQCIADQIACLVRESRGRETMRIMYNDPYSRILSLVEADREDLDKQLVGEVRGTLKDLFSVRSERLSDEALALAPTHFDVLTFLSGLLMLGYLLGTVATTGDSCATARILFAALIVCYVILYEMAYDLNRPFGGIYQLRRDGVAVHFLQVKNLISEHPVLRNVIDFDLDDEVDDELMGFTECEGECNRRKARIWYN